MIKVTILGTGTSTGVPVITCQCKVCTSNEQKNNRTRCSAFLEFFNEDNQLLSNCLIDTSTDFRQQALSNKITNIDNILYTHAHADHTHGIDDLRVFSFTQKNPINIFASEPFYTEIIEKFSYLFFENPEYEGGLSINLKHSLIDENKTINLPGVKAIPVPVFHGKSRILGYRFSDFAYITDASNIPDESYSLLKNLKYLIINGLRHKPHPTHFTVEKALQEIEKIAPKKAFLTHISHDLEHRKVSEELEKQTNGVVSLAFDGLTFEC